jgi:hypothetical protein
MELLHGNQIKNILRSLASLGLQCERDGPELAINYSSLVLQHQQKFLSYNAYEILHSVCRNDFFPMGYSRSNQRNSSVPSSEELSYKLRIWI